MEKLRETLEAIEPADQHAMEEAQNYIDQLAKPIGSLGKMEDIAVKYASITGKIKNQVHKKVVIVMAADNGVVEEGVSSAPQIITTIQTNAIAGMNSGVGVFARYAGADLEVVDIGCKEPIRHPEVKNRKIMPGTNNIKKGPAMTREQAIRAIETGIEITEDLINRDYDLFGTGEMGIGNTTTSSAVLSALLRLPAEETTGLGGGITKEQYNKKIGVIQKAIEVNRPDSEDVIDCIAKVCGLDIAGLTGVFLACARHKKPVVIDGVISGTAALCAYILKKETRDYMFPSHKSDEKGYEAICQALNMEPFLHLNMRLGEGSGCPLAFTMIEAALMMVREMDTFEQAGIHKNDADRLVDIRSGEKSL